MNNIRKTVVSTMCAITVICGNAFANDTSKMQITANSAVTSSIPAATSYEGATIENIPDSAHWKLTLAALREQESANDTATKLRARGYPAQVSLSSVDDEPVFLVRIVGIASENDAVALALRLKLRLGIEAVSISR